MRVHFTNRPSADFPMTAFKIRDLIDRLGISHDEPAVDFDILPYDNMELPSCLCKDYHADIYMLNLFADRYNDLSENDRSKLISLIKTHPDSTIDDMVCMTFGLDNVPDFPCHDYESLGEFAVDNDILPEIAKCPDEIVPYLDKEMLGRMLAEREQGVIMDGRYFVTSEYEKPDLNISISHETSSIFNLLLAPSFDEIAQAQWVSFPCPSMKLDMLSKDFGSKIGDAYCFDFESALPKLSVGTNIGMKDFEELNTLSKRLNQLSRDDLIKLKAVMENENISDIDGVNSVLSALHEYEFDASVRYFNTFGSEYLVRNLPTNFDHTVLDDADLTEFGQAILGGSGGGITDYGAVSARGVGLYAPITSDMEQKADETESEDFNMGMEMKL